LVRNLTIKTAVLAVVVHSGHAFSGGAATGIVDDVGAVVTGRRGPSVAAP
jgi:hypothetical protein